MSRRDDAIVAWHEVPGTAPPRKDRPVGYGVIRAGVRTSGSYARSYRTLRDGSFEGYVSRHFVPGYDRRSLRDKAVSKRLLSCTDLWKGVGPTERFATHGEQGGGRLTYIREAELEPYP
jgi:hypothetical protein